ncbi:MAG: hypothetical protein K0S55_1215, partial [Clostridia bacterium]|nr:hypothetical protein [Clostridia bacterium]
MDFTFNGSMSREVLNNYLSHAVTHYGIGYDGNFISQTFEDDLRMFKHMGAKFIGRAAFVWSSSVDDKEHFKLCEERAYKTHEFDSELILQACVFECIYKPFVNSVEIPEFVFNSFGLPYEKRCFKYEDMIFTDGKFIGQWGKDSSVEDITRLESRMWIFYRAASYIKAGFEGIHFGQVCLIGANDVGFKYWHEVILMLRDYAKKNARRHYVLFDAHTLGDLRLNTELFDYNAFPIRLKEILDKPMECICEEGYLDSMFNEIDGNARSFIVEFDNFGGSDFSGKPNHKSHFAWGYDEITWFALQNDEYRHNFLRYIWKWVNDRYPEGWVQMPSRRCMTEFKTFSWNKPDKKWLDKVSYDECLKYKIEENGIALIT